MMFLLAKIWRHLNLSKGFQLFIMGIVQDRFLVGVTGIFFNENKEVLLFKHSYRQIPWSLPGGYLKSREHPSEGLEREIKEESGLTVSADWEMETRTDRQVARIDLSYTGKFIGGEFTPSAEVREYGLFSFDDLPLIRKNQLYLIQEALKKERS